MPRTESLVLTLLFMALLAAAPSASAELIGYWSADTVGGQGDALANDQGNTDLDGELVEAVYTGGGGGHTGQRTDFAMEFEGFDEEYVVVPPAEVEFEEITMTAWINGDPTGTWSGIITTRSPQTLYLGFYNDTRDLAYVWNDNTEDTWGWQSEVEVSEDEWNFVALTVTADAATVYAGPKGGELDFASNEIDHFPQDNPNEWRFGEDDCCGTERNFSGRIDDVSIWDEALSLEQLTALFRETESPLSIAGLGPRPGEGGARLLAGDADQDLDFDQLDLVQVQIAGKYLSATAATWGEGDWDGAPGGSQGSPPAGDGMFNQLDIISALSAGVYLTGPYGAIEAGGASGDGQTSIVYDPGTGEVAIDAPAGVELTSVNIDSAGGIFTADAAQNLGGSFDNDADNNIFKATFGGSFGSISLGNVAPTGLAQDFLLNDLSVVGSLAGGGDLGDVDLVYVPEPTCLTILLIGLSYWLAARRGAKR